MALYMLGSATYPHTPYNPKSVLEIVRKPGRSLTACPAESDRMYMHVGYTRPIQKFELPKMLGRYSAIDAKHHLCGCRYHSCAAALYTPVTDEGKWGPGFHGTSAPWTTACHEPRQLFNTRLSTYLEFRHEL